MRIFIRVIDSISERIALSVRWLYVPLVGVMAYEVIARYVFNSPTGWAFETSIMINIAVITLLWSYVLKHDGHIRIDIIYLKFSPRSRTVIDVVGTFLLFFPLMYFMIQTSFEWAWQAWATNEKMVESAWYPPIAPIRTLVVVGFILLALQGLVKIIRDLYFLIRNKQYD